MKKVVKKITALALTVLVTTCSVALPVYADGYRCSHGYSTHGDKKMNYGVGDYGNNHRYYWVDTKFSSTYKNYIANAVSDWVNTTSGVGVTTSISIRKTTTKSDAYFEFVRNTTLGSNTLGQTKWYLYQQELRLNSAGALPSNYGWARLSINSSALDSHNISAAQKKATCAHELGHGLGLSHRNTVPSSIMCQYQDSTRKATRASASDCKTVNHLYG